MTAPEIGLSVALGALTGHALLNGCDPEAAVRILRRQADQIDAAALIADAIDATGPAAPPPN